MQQIRLDFGISNRKAEVGDIEYGHVMRLSEAHSGAGGRHSMANNFLRLEILISLPLRCATKHFR
jgi:hypothetical protein